MTGFYIIATLTLNRLTILPNKFTYSEEFSIIFTKVLIPFLLINSFANEGSSACPAPSIPAKCAKAFRLILRSGRSISAK